MMLSGVYAGVFGNLCWCFSPSFRPSGASRFLGLRPPGVEGEAGELGVRIPSPPEGDDGGERRSRRFLGGSRIFRLWGGVLGGCFWMLFFFFFGGGGVLICFFDGFCCFLCVFFL